MKALRAFTVAFTPDRSLLSFSIRYNIGSPKNQPISRILFNNRAVGPGHVSLVMNDVLSKLVNVGYKPAKVLKELQMDTDENDDTDLEKQVT